MPQPKNTSKKNIVQIYTDGSCLGNPGKGGWGAIIQHDDSEKILQGSSPATTNNRMEMTAIVAALIWTNKNISTKSQIKIFSDSNLIIQSLLQNWKRKKNLDLWEKLDVAIESLESNGGRIEWHWVKGHAGNTNNNRADKIALSAAMNAR